MVNKKKVLIVDDSAYICQILSEIYNSDPQLQVIGTVCEPYAAVEFLRKQVPDVISLDIEMPKMNGLTFLSKLMSQHPIPVVVVSTLTTKNSYSALKALELGAVDIVSKPKINAKNELISSQKVLCDIMKAAATANVKRTLRSGQINNTINDITSKKSINKIVSASNKIIALGASTGGTEALKEILMKMPFNAPGIVIVQHMPQLFTKQFASRLDNLCQIKVKEAKDGDLIMKGCALLAPGDKHMMLRKNGSYYYVKMSEGPLVNRHKPSVDVLFRSVARIAGRNAYGVLLTGMGNDGAKGLLEMRQSKAQTIAQSEKTCVIYGMPKIAVSIGAVDHILDLNQIPDFLLKHMK